MTTRNGKMFSIIITVIYIRCMLCATTESHYGNGVGVVSSVLYFIDTSVVSMIPVEEISV
jgi:hypothetical protein